MEDMKERISENKTKIRLLEQTLTSIGSHFTESTSNLSSQIQQLSIEIGKLSDTLTNDYITKDILRLELQNIKTELNITSNNTNSIGTKLWGIVEKIIYVVIGALLLKIGLQ